MDEFKENIHCRSFLKFFSNRISFEMSFYYEADVFSESVAVVLAHGQVVVLGECAVIPVYQPDRIQPQLPLERNGGTNPFDFFLNLAKKDAWIRMSHKALSLGISS